MNELHGSNEHLLPPWPAELFRLVEERTKELQRKYESELRAAEAALT